jgi:ATP-dependent DNA ligase
LMIDQIPEHEATLRLLARIFAVCVAAAFIHPCQPIVAKQPPSGPGWAHELKHDGYRLQSMCGMGVCGSIQ